MAVATPAAVLFTPPMTASKNPSFAPEIAPFAKEYPKPGRGTVGTEPAETHPELNTHTQLLLK